MKPAPEPVRVMLVWCPQWPVLAARMIHRVPAEAPMALVAKGAVVACSPTAREEGIRPGDRLRQAQHRCPDLTVLQHDPDAEQRAFEPVLRAMADVVPSVHLVRPGVAAVRASGAARFYGSEVRAAQELQIAVRRAHPDGAPEVHVAVADGLFAAEQAAYQGVEIVPPGDSPGLLADLPVTVIAEAAGDPKMANVLRRMGIRTIGALAGLPREQVFDRFGASGLRAHQLACGLDAPILNPRTAPDELAARIVLEEPSDAIEVIISECGSAVEQLSARINDGSLVCTGIRIITHHEPGPRESAGEIHEREWRHPWHLGAREILDRVQWQLADLGKKKHRPITLVEIAATELDAAVQHSQGLWGDRPDDHVLHTLTGLQHRLGYDAVLVGSVVGGRMLHERQSFSPFGQATPDRAVRRLEQPWPDTVPGPAPSVVFQEAQAMRVLTEHGTSLSVSDRGVLTGVPTTAQWPGREASRISAWAGPWPVNGRWWRRAQTDQKPLHRFQLVDDHQQAWLVLHAAGQWWAEARYD